MSKTAKKPAKNRGAKPATASKPHRPAKKKKAAPKKVSKSRASLTPSSVKKKAGATKKTKKVATKKSTTKPSSPAGKKVVAKPSSSAGKKAVSKPSSQAGKKTVSKPSSSAGKKAISKKIVSKKIVSKKPAPAKAPRPHSPLLSAIIEGLEERKAHNITVLDLNLIGSRSFDYFVIADADSKTHVESIAGSVEEEVKKKLSERPYHTEGWQNGEWILLDYVNIVVHVFQRPIREFYNLEGLWADAEVQKIN